MNWPRRCSIVFTILVSSQIGAAQRDDTNTAPPAETMQQHVERLAAEIVQQEAALKASLEQIEHLHAQVVELQNQLTASQSPNASPAEDTDVARLKSEVDGLREQQDVQQSEIAVHEQTKVESESKFPVKLTGLILMNAFSNSSGVDVIQSPTLATGTGGTTGITLRQTVLGLDARGPRLFGSNSSADVRVDLFGGLSQAGYAEAGGTARLRTAHAELNWTGTRAFFALDRPILNPDALTSLTAVAQPELAWSGNLWNWIPQAGVERSLWHGERTNIGVEGAVADIPDPSPLGSNSTAVQNASLAEQRRAPASEVRLSYAHGDPLTGLQVGAGSYFSPHSDGDDFHFDAWAATVDYRVPLGSRMQASGSAYRGSALGGLGGGAFKDYTLEEAGARYVVHPLDDVGGWSQLKGRINERFELNGGYGIDNAFAHELRRYSMTGQVTYQNLARNSTAFANVIYSPTAYTLFSFEYRRIDSSPATGSHSMADVYGIAAGYRF